MQSAVQALEPAAAWRWPSLLPPSQDVGTLWGKLAMLACTCRATSPAQHIALGEAQHVVPTGWSLD